MKERARRKAKGDKSRLLTTSSSRVPVTTNSCSTSWMLSSLPLISKWRKRRTRALRCRVSALPDQANGARANAPRTGRPSRKAAAACHARSHGFVHALESHGAGASQI